MLLHAFLSGSVFARRSNGLANQPRQAIDGPGNGGVGFRIVQVRRYSACRFDRRSNSTSRLSSAPGSVDLVESNTDFCDRRAKSPQRKGDASAGMFPERCRLTAVQTEKSNPHVSFLFRTTTMNQYE